MPGTTRFRRSAHVVCHWRGPIAVLFNYALGIEVRASPEACTIVAECRRWRTLDQLREACPDLGPGAVRHIVGSLARSGILHRSGRPPAAAERKMDALAPWNPAAGFFHSATRNVRFSPPARGSADPWLRAQPGRSPAPVKRHPGRPAKALPRPVLEGAFPDVLLARRTWRRFARRRLPLHELSTLLALTGGIHWWVDEASGRAALRTSPSGGARHPIDLYVLAQDVAGLAPGLYHYASDRHQLERIGRRRPGGVQRYLPHQDWYESAAALIFFAASFKRTLFRYKYARAYRAVLIEAGHLCQTFCLSATWRGLAPFCSLALADTKADRDLGLDGITESVLYVAGVGMPDGSSMPPLAPRGVSPPAVVQNPAFRRTRDKARPS